MSLPETDLDASILAFAHSFLKQAEVPAAFEALLFVWLVNDVLDDDPINPTTTAAANGCGGKRRRRLAIPAIASVNS